ncbi:MAG: UPF0149 family protein [Chlorobiaceae bacterium]
MEHLNILCTPLSAWELEELDSVLRLELFSSDVMTLDALDGFATALAIGPVAITAEEWVPYVFGTRELEGDNVSSLEEDQRLRWLLIRYMGALESAIRSDPDGFMPVFNLRSYPSREDEESAVASWAEAFMFGIELYSDYWEPIFSGLDAWGEEAALLLGPMLLLAGAEDEDQALSGDERLRLKALACQSVSRIYRFWYAATESSSQAKSNIMNRGARIFTITRDDRCPCGSGSKCGKCCGT